MMEKRVIILCYMFIIGFCTAEKLAQRSLEEVDATAALLAYAKELADQNQAIQKSYGVHRQMLPRARFYQDERREQQGHAGLWGKRQEPLSWQEQYGNVDRKKENRNVDLREKRTESSKKEQQYGSAGLWGKRQSLDRITDEMDTDWRARRVQNPDETGLWGKRNKKGVFRLEREAAMVREKQPNNIGLWNGKRSARRFKKQRGSEEERSIPQHGKTGLWGRRMADEAGMWERKNEDGNSKKTAYVR